jgi:tetratricopeptide (TPR) repeat protein
VRSALRWAALVSLVILTGGCMSLAVSAQQKADEANAQQAETYFQEAELLYEQGDHAQATERYDRALELDPQRQDAWYKKGEIQRLQGVYEQAVESYGRALEIDPGYVTALGGRGESYRALGRSDEALADLDEAIRLDPEYAWAYASRGETWRGLEDYEQAVADFSEAISRDPDYPWALGRRGESYRMLGRHEEAIADLDRTIELWPEDSYAYASRGQAYREIGEYELALADLDRAIELDGNYQWAMDRREELLAEMSGEEAPADGSAAPATSAPDRGVLPLVAVLDFRVENIAASEGKLIVDLLSSALIRARRYRVLDRSQQESILKEIEFSLSDCVDERCQLKIGQMLSAEKIVVGSLGRVGGRYILNAKLLHVQTGEALGSAYQVFASLDALVDGVEQLAVSLSEQ